MSDNNNPKGLQYREPRKVIATLCQSQLLYSFLVFDWSTLNMLQFAASTEVRDLLSRFPECVLLGGIAARVETQKALPSSSLSMNQFSFTQQW